MINEAWWGSEGETFWLNLFFAPGQHDSASYLSWTLCVCAWLFKHTLRPHLAFPWMTWCSRPWASSPKNETEQRFWFFLVVTDQPDGRPSQQHTGSFSRLKCERQSGRQCEGLTSDLEGKNGGVSAFYSWCAIFRGAETPQALCRSRPVAVCFFSSVLLITTPSGSSPVGTQPTSTVLVKLLSDTVHIPWLAFKSKASRHAHTLTDPHCAPLALRTVLICSERRHAARKISVFGAGVLIMFQKRK